MSLFKGEFLKSNKGNLIKNTAMLYILQFSTYFFSFITVPYQTRILGPDIYGKLGFATAVMVYFQLFLDFGFMLSATAKISHNRSDKEFVSRISTCVTVIKVIFSIVSIAILVGLCITVPQFGSDSKLMLLFLFATIFNSLMPDYLYRGIEQMTTITVRTLLIKMFFTAMIFVFLKGPDDYYIIPVLNIIGNLGALLGVYVHLFLKLKIPFCKVKLNEILEELKESSSFFLSRIATTVYTTSNTVILKFLSNSNVDVGYYTSADKLVTTSKSALSPISDSIYPYMIKHKDFKLIKKTLKIFMPIIIVFAIIAFVFAPEICSLIFGPEFRPVAPIFRALLPVIVITLPNYILGFPTLGAMGLAKYANISIVVGTIVHIVLLISLYFMGYLNVVTLGMLTSISEFSILLYRCFVIYKNRHLFNCGVDN